MSIDVILELILLMAIGYSFYIEYTEVKYNNKIFNWRDSILIGGFAIAIFLNMIGFFK